MSKEYDRYMEQLLNTLNNIDEYIRPNMLIYATAELSQGVRKDFYDIFDKIKKATGQINAIGKQLIFEFDYTFITFKQIKLIEQYLVESDNGLHKSNDEIFKLFFDIGLTE